MPFKSILDLKKFCFHSPELFTFFRSRSKSKTKSHYNDGLTAAVNGAFSDLNTGKENGDVKSNAHICQALISDDGVVLDLEDCCQMTICEKVSILARSSC